MTASPAQVANDLAAQAAYFRGRDGEVEATCRDAARLIRHFLNSEPIDGRTLRGVLTRLQNLAGSKRWLSGSQITKSAERGLQTLIDLSRHRDGE